MIVKMIVLNIVLNIVCIEYESIEYDESKDDCIEYCMY